MSELRDEIRIHAGARSVWAVLADPEALPTWHDKVTAADRPATGPLVPGERYRLVRRLGKREHEVEVEVLEVDEPRRLLVRERGLDWAEDRQVTLEMRLSEHEGRTRVLEIVDLTRSPLPWPVRLLAGLLHRHGRKVGPGHLERLRDLVEARDGAAT